MHFENIHSQVTNNKVQEYPT